MSRVRGNRGELVGVSLTGDPERLRGLGRVFLFGGGAEYRVESVWFHDGRPVFKFRGVDSIAEAEPLRGAEVRVPFSERRKLEPGEFFHSELVGCEVIEEGTGERLGKVVAFVEGTGPGLLELDSGLLTPFVRAILIEIDPAAGRIVARLPEGLKDLNRP
ncbi:MAG: 16S rRNA processing protein RimM [Acidobacteria bacterium]|nr:16S rRNA processing protein RimM [Acidobacteriota bacterium]